MRKVYTVFEFFLSLMLIAVGVFVFSSGYSGSPQFSMVVLPIGALFFVLGCVILAYAIRSQIWHRRMLRQRPLPGTGPMPELSHRN
jgi:hypothetical protein